MIESARRKPACSLPTGDRFLVGITEDVPDEVRQSSLRAINDGLGQWGALPLRER
jgi:hypothetical protein